MAEKKNDPKKGQINIELDEKIALRATTNSVEFWANWSGIIF